MHASAGLRAIFLATIMAVLAVAGCYPPPAITASPVAARDVWARAAVTLPAAAPASAEMPQGMAEGQMAHGGGANSAVFLTLTNRGPAADRLVAAQAAVSQAVEIHETRLQGDVMTMQQVANGIEIPANGQVELKPGGYHIMLIGLTQDLVPGDRFPLTLQFATAAPLTVEAEVRQP